MRVAIVTESFLPSINGVTNSVLRVADTLIERGHDVLIAAPTSEGSRYRGASVVRGISVEIAGFPIGLPAANVTQALDAFAPDLVHAAAPFWFAGHALAYASRRGIASVAVYQTDVAGFMGRYGLDFAGPIVDALVATIHRQATLTLVPTPDGVRYMQRLGIERVGVWGRGVDDQLFAPAGSHHPRVDALRRAWAPGGERIVGYVGRLAPEKQVGRLKELCAIPGVRLVVVGDGPDREELEDQFFGHGVTFTGALSGVELADAYRAFDLFVHCGEEETFGQTIQEAKATGLPVVVADRGGPRHLINHGMDGFLVDPSRWGSYRVLVETLLADDELRHRIGRQARRSVEGKSWGRNNDELIEHYRLALSRPGTRWQPVAA